MAPLERGVQPVQPRPLTTDVVITLGAKVGILLLNVAGTVVIARALGPTGRGAVAVAFSFTLLLIQLGILGLHSANAYFAAREPAQISRIITNTLWTALVAGMLLALAGLAVRQLFPATLRGLDLLEVAVVLIGVPAALGNQLLQSILLAEGRMVAYNGVELGMSLLMTVGLIVGLSVFSFGVLGAIALLVGVNVGGTCVFLALLRRHRIRLRGFDGRLLSEMLRYGSRIYLAALLAYLVWRLNLLLVNSYRGSAAAGQFAIAFGFADAIHLLPTVVALNLFPRIARGGATDTGAVFRSLTLVYGLLCALTIPLAGPVIRLFYGDAFSPATTIYYWLLPGIFSYGMVAVLAYHFAGRGFPVSALLAWVPGLVVNLAIVFPLLSRGGSANVAALSVSVSFTLVLALHMRLFASEAGGYRSLIARPRETLVLVGELLRVLRPTETH